MRSFPLAMSLHPEPSITLTGAPALDTRHRPVGGMTERSLHGVLWINMRAAPALAVETLTVATLGNQQTGPNKRAPIRRYLQSGFVCLRRSRRGCFVCF
jgi:hypothetical protein